MTNEKFAQTLTVDEAEEIADLLVKFEGALKQYRTENIHLSKDDKNLLIEAEQGIHLLSEQMYTVAVGLVINDAQASVDKIKQATQDAKAAVQTITTIKKVIAIAAGVIKIGASVMSKDIGGIVGGIGQVTEAVAS